jgi:DNA-binding beta-propeller fold protein YncE
MNRRPWLAVGLALAVLILAAEAQAARHVYVTNSAVPGGSSVSQYEVGAGGLLAPLIPPTVAAGTFPLAVTVTPDGRSVYVANADSDTLSQYDVGAAGALAPKNPGSVPGGDSPSSVAVSPDGRSVYVTDTLGSNVSQFDVDLGGMLTVKSPATVPAGRSPFGVAVSPDGRSVYVVNQRGNTLSQYDVGAGGVLTPKMPAEVPTGMSPSKVAVSPNGSSVYVTLLENFSGLEPGAVAQFDVQADGALTPKNPPTVATESGPQGLAVSPDGRNVYVANTLGDSISQFSASANGVLTPKSPASLPAPSPFGVAVSGDAGSVYVTTAGAGDIGTVSQFDVGAGGVLIPKNPPTVAAGVGAAAVAVGPDLTPPVPTSIQQCKHGGWRDFGVFKNEGDCVSFVATRGKNPPGQTGG